MVCVVECKCPFHRLVVPKHATFVLCFDGLWRRRRGRCALVLGRGIHGPRPLSVSTSHDGSDQDQNCNESHFRFSLTNFQMLPAILKRFGQQGFPTKASLLNRKVLSL